MSAGSDKVFMVRLGGGSGVAGQEFHFVTGRGVSVSDLATMIVGLTDSSSRIIQSPPNNFEVRRFVGDPGKSHKVLGHEPRVRLEEGLKILRERMLPTVTDTRYRDEASVLFDIEGKG